MAGDKVLFSFIIPSYNRAHSLPSAIESIVQQSSPNWELIIVDDGSTDGTKEAIKDYLQDSRVNYVHQAHSGVSVARNYGVANSKGEFIIFLDSDDRVNEDLVKCLYEINPWKYDLICWEVERVIDNKKFIQKPRNLGKLYNGITAVFLAGSVCYKKRIFVEAGGYDDRMTFGENFELGLRISERKDLKIKIINRTFLYYFLDTRYRISNDIKNRLHSHLHQYEKHKERYKRNRKANSLISYLIAYTLEKSDQKAAALDWYKKSWRSNPFNLKPMLKLLYLNIF